MTMRLTHIDHGFYRISDADAGRLAKGVGKKLPRHGYQLAVELPVGVTAGALRSRNAWLQRTSFTGRADSPKRGWVWAIFQR